MAAAGRMMMAAGAELALRLVAVRSRAARLPGPDEIRVLEAAALAKPRRTMTPAEIRALAAEAIASLHEPKPAFQRARKLLPRCLSWSKPPLRHRCCHLPLPDLWFL